MLDSDSSVLNSYVFYAILYMIISITIATLSLIINELDYDCIKFLSFIKWNAFPITQTPYYNDVIMM